MRSLPLAFFVWWLGFATGAHAASKDPFRGVDNGWRRYQSEHFELFSHNGSDASRQLLHHLELLRGVFFGTVGLQEVRPMEVTIYYFSRERDFRAYLPEMMQQNQNIAAFYLSRPDRAVIVIGPAYEAEESQRLIFHEYIHHLTAIAGQRPALWYTEGIAELFSTITVTPDGLAVGEAIDGHVGYLQQHGFMPLEDLFATDASSPNYNETRRTGLFYAESWALLHYWFFGNSGLSRDKLAAFMHYSEQDADNRDSEQRRELFEATTGLDYAAAVQKLSNYVRGGDFRVFKLPAPRVAAAASYAARPVSRDEIRGRLVELEFRTCRSPLAKLELLGRVEKLPGDTRALEVLGTDALLDGDETLARDRWEQALAAGSHNPAVYHELGALENREWFTNFDPIHFRLPNETAQHLRMLLGRSIENTPQQAQAYEMLAWVEATAEQPAIANVNLIQKHFSQLIEKPRTLVALALVRIRFKDYATARSLLGEVEAMAPAPEIFQSAALVRQYLDAQATAAPAQGATP